MHTHTRRHTQAHQWAADYFLVRMVVPGTKPVENPWSIVLLWVPVIRENSSGSLVCGNKATYMDILTLFLWIWISHKARRYDQRGNNHSQLSIWRPINNMLLFSIQADGVSALSKPRSPLLQLMAVRENELSWIVTCTMFHTDHTWADSPYQRQCRRACWQG